MLRLCTWTDNSFLASNAPSKEEFAFLILSAYTTSRWLLFEVESRMTRKIFKGLVEYFYEIVLFNAAISGNAAENFKNQFFTG